MITNDAMKRVLLNKEAIGYYPKGELDAIADQGFFASEDCYLLSAYAHLSRGKRADFMDPTGYECFYNSVSIGDYVDNNLLCEGIRFIERIFAVWKATHPSIMLVAILLLDDDDATVKIHVKRPGENWLSDNLDVYEEPILVAHSTEGDLHRSCRAFIDR
jgi:hypothetical protein